MCAILGGFSQRLVSLERFLGYLEKSLQSLSFAVRMEKTVVYLIGRKICQMYFTHSSEWLPSLFSDIPHSKKWIQYLPFLLKLLKSLESKNYIHHDHCPERDTYVI
mmetsp:Transcript_18673/g.26287  ORF Transcript_18673/g.26287 Transcript_18673/m.26287 type:complete len:106 (-) Transcript_18673:40-357(-)